MKTIITNLFAIGCLSNLLGETIVPVPEETKRISMYIATGDQAALAEFAQNKDNETEFRQMALEHLTDKIVLAKIAQNDENEWIRMRAAGMLNDQLLLADFAENVKDIREKILSKPNTVTCENPADKLKAIELFDTAFKDLYAPFCQYELSVKDLGIQNHRLPCGNAALHLLNYKYDAAIDLVPKLDEVVVTVKNAKIKTISLYALNQEAKNSVTVDKSINGQDTVINLKNVPPYLVLELGQ